jgi:hypothetical protein
MVSFAAVYPNTLSGTRPRKRAQLKVGIITETRGIGYVPLPVQNDDSGKQCF